MLVHSAVVLKHQLVVVLTLQHVTTMLTLFTMTALVQSSMSVAFVAVLVLLTAHVIVTATYLMH